jgi:aspartyl/asparaginyl-tRNA synthetase
MEFRFIVLDEFGESIRAFYTRDDAERFVKTRHDFTIEEIPHEELPEEEKLTYQDMLDQYGDSPF